MRTPSSVQIHAELQRLTALNSYLPALGHPDGVPRRKIEHYALIGQRYHVSELQQLKPLRRHCILACYLWVRKSQLLDLIVEMTIQTWRRIHKVAVTHASLLRNAKAAAQDDSEAVFKDLLDIICDSPTDYDLVRKIRTYRSRDAYEGLRRDLGKRVSWNTSYYGVIPTFVQPSIKFKK